jgi:pimeloyl-ACP methyl ester carboxylesterase
MRIHFFLCATSFLALLLIFRDSTMAQPPESASFSLPNVKMPTLGGKQFWTDHVWRQGWRIQCNALTGHWRLLDPENTRHAWGTRAACETCLESQGLELALPTQRVAIMLHGLMRSATSMRPVGNRLAKVNDGQTYSLVYFEYASTRSSMSDHAQALREVIAGLPPDAELSFVGHSMGNIILRHLIGDLERAGDQETLRRITHVVMLGPPNQGASIARQLSKTGVFGWVTGKGGLELGPEWETFERKLATPGCPFGIIAGRLPESSPTNPLVGAEGDFVVSIEETKLEGATDFLEVPRLHTFLMEAPEVQAAVERFLSTNSFRE